MTKDWYLNVYNSIILNSRSHRELDYKESHHIVPRCVGGTDDPSNIVDLTAREHFLCHLLLCEIYPNESKLKYALFLMAIGKNKKLIKYKINNRLYERLKIEYIKISKGKLEPKNFGNKIKSLERNKKIGDANRGKPKPKGFKEKISKLNKGKIRNKEFIKKLIKNKSKSVLQYDLEGNFIKKWFSAKEAGKELNINNSQINAVARGNTKFKTAGKFKWKYENKD